MSQYVFLSGTARGGTNLVTKALSVGQGIHLANDPYLALLKYLRRDFLQEYFDRPFNADDPLPDYYYQENYQELVNAILQANRNPHFDESHKELLISDIKKRASVSTPLIVDKLNELKGDNYKTLIESALKILAQAFNLQDPKAIGFNENWAIELFPLLNFLHPHAKFIVIYRDPRPAICSALKQKDTTKAIQVLSFLRGWRKNIAFMLHLQKDPRFKDKLKVCKYEDFVTKPEEHLRDLSTFLGISYTEKMMDSSEYKDGAGQIWKGNSYIHEKRPEGIYTDSIHAWQGQLAPEITEAVEFITAPELRYLGYEMKYFNGTDPSPKAIDFLKKDFTTKSSWKNTSQSLEQELEKEIFRLFLANSQYTQFSADEIKRFFIFDHVYLSLRKVRV